MRYSKKVIPFPKKGPQAPRSVFALVISGSFSIKSPENFKILSGIKCHIKGKRRPANADKLVFPGGGRKPSDASDLAALLREVREETGLKVVPISEEWLVYTETVIRNGKKMKADKAFLICMVVDGTLGDTPELRGLKFRPAHRLLNRPEGRFARLHHRALQRAVKGPLKGFTASPLWPEAKPPADFPTKHEKNRRPAERAS